MHLAHVSCCEVLMRGCCGCVCVVSAVGVAKSGSYVVDDAPVRWSYRACHHIHLWSLPFSSLCSVNCVSCPCILWRPISVSSTDMS